MKVHLTTLGCPKNQVDSELMLGMLTEAGFPLVEQPEDAECLIVNTCAFIDRAREESIDTILELAKLKERGSCRVLIVTGCLTQRYGGGRFTGEAGDARAPRPPRPPPDVPRGGPGAGRLRPGAPARPAHPFHLPTPPRPAG